MISAYGDGLHLTVQDQRSKTLHLSLRKKVPMRVLMTAALKRLQAAPVQFTFRGRQIKPSDTPESLGLQSTDVVELQWAPATAAQEVPPKAAEKQAALAAKPPAVLPKAPS